MIIELVSNYMCTGYFRFEEATTDASRSTSIATPGLGSVTVGPGYISSTSRVSCLYLMFTHKQRDFTVQTHNQSEVLTDKTDDWFHEVTVDQPMRHPRRT